MGLQSINLKRWAIAVLLAGPTLQALADSAEEFGARRYPAAPALDISKQPELCRQILDSATRLYRSSIPTFDLATAATTTKVRVEVWDQVESASDQKSFVESLEVDLDGNGKRQVLVRQARPHSWRGDWHYAYLFPTRKAFEASWEEVVARSTQHGQYPDARQSLRGERAYFPSATSMDGKSIVTGNVWAQHTLLSFKGRYYFFFAYNDFDLLQPTTPVLYRLHGNGKVEEVCRLVVRGQGEAQAAFLAQTGIGSFLKTLRTIGTGGEDCGTMHSAIVHEASSAAAELRAATRPWATDLESNGYYQYNEKTLSFLEEWSRSDLWSRREYQTFQEHIAPAERAMARFFEKSYGLAPDIARSSADRTVISLIGSHFLLPGGFDATEDSIELYFGSPRLRNAIADRDRKSLDDLLIAAAADGGFKQRSGESIPLRTLLSRNLAEVIEWPYALQRFLAEPGVDPNHRNEFGKTPLMVAAHMNRPDAIRVLIKAGAQLNDTTNPGERSCGGGMERTGRSALTYAAENASPIVMQLLIDAGADAQIKDSKGNALDYYLAMNPRLTPEDRALGTARLAVAAERFAGPSFDCAKAKSPQEKAICGSEVTRMLDFELSRAYRSLGKDWAALILADQKAWIGRRDRSCTTESGIDDCLAEKMRTRVRFLHNILQEKHS